MGHTFYFLTATWIAAQGAGPEVLHQPQPYDNVMQTSCGCQQESVGYAEPAARSWNLRGMFGASSDCGCNRPGLLERLQSKLSGMFHRDAGCGQEEDFTSIGGEEIMPPANEYQKMPSLPASTKANEPPLADTVKAQAPELPIVKDQAVAPINFKANSAPAEAPAAAPKAPAAKSLSPKLTEKIGHEADYSWITGQIHHESGQWVIRYAAPETVDRHGGTLVLAPGTDMSTFRDGDLISVHGQVLGSGPGALYRASSVHLVERESK